MKTYLLATMMISTISALSAQGYYNSCPYDQMGYRPANPQGQPYYQGGPAYDQGQPYYQSGPSYYQGGNYYQGSENRERDYNQSSPNNRQWNLQNQQNYDQQRQQNFDQQRQPNYNQSQPANPNRYSDSRDMQSDTQNNPKTYQDDSRSGRWDNSLMTWGYDNNKATDQRNANRNGGYVSDQEISKKIHDEIAGGWLSKGYEKVTFEVNNGNVMLRGSVDTQDDKNKIEEKVKKIDGVKQINNQIIVAKSGPGYMADNASKVKKYEEKFPNDRASSENDRIINAKIRDKLNGGWFSSGYENIVLRTNNGVVTISGVVDNMNDIQKIGNEVLKIDGVKNVNNQLSAKKQ